MLHISIIIGKNKHILPSLLDQGVSPPGGNEESPWYNG